MEKSIIMSGIVGLITGAIGSLVTPWIKWGIEKRKIKLTERCKFIEDVRKQLQTASDKRIFRESAIYSRIRPHLRGRTRSIIEGDAIFIQKGGRGAGVDNYKSRVLDDLHSLEKTWGLI